MKSLLTGLLLFVCVLNTHAAIISGSHTTSGGKEVNLQGLEWLSWDETYGVSRTSIEADYNGYLSDGWVFATTTQLTSLFQSLWGGVDGWNESNFDGAQWVWENFDNPDFLNSGSYYSRTGNLFVGTEGECNLDPDRGCQAHWRASKDTQLFNNGTTNTTYQQGWFSSFYGASTDYASILHDSHLYASSVLVRVTSVPEALSLYLLAFGLLGLLGSARRKA